MSVCFTCAPQFFLHFSFDVTVNSDECHSDQKSILLNHLGTQAIHFVVVYYLVRFAKFMSLKKNADTNCGAMTYFLIIEILKLISALSFWKISFPKNAIFFYNLSLVRNKRNTSLYCQLHCADHFFSDATHHPTSSPPHYLTPHFPSPPLHPYTSAHSR